jgi:hypothetical protein
MAMELLDDQDDHGPFLDDVTLLEIANCPVRYVELSEECSYLPPDSTIFSVGNSSSKAR